MVQEVESPVPTAYGVQAGSQSSLTSYPNKPEPAVDALAAESGNYDDNGTRTRTLSEQTNHTHPKTTKQLQSLKHIVGRHPKLVRRSLRKEPRLGTLVLEDGTITTNKEKSI